VLLALLIFLWILNRMLDDVPCFPIDHGDTRPAASGGQSFLAGRHADPPGGQPGTTRPVL